jgi:hypothetical protein
MIECSLKECFLSEIETVKISYDEKKSMFAALGGHY